MTGLACSDSLVRERSLREVDGGTSSSVSTAAAES